MASYDGWSIAKKFEQAYEKISAVLSKHERVIVVLATKIDNLEKLQKENHGKQKKPKVRKVVKSSKKVQG